MTSAKRARDRRPPLTLRFQCQPGCTICCRQTGSVYLSEDDLKRAAAYLALTPEEFESRYVYRTRHRLRLRKPPRSQCHFLMDDGCAIHPAKPTQCRAYPLWPEWLSGPEAWQDAAKVCPGIGQGPLIRIETALRTAAEMRAAYPAQYP